MGHNGSAVAQSTRVDDVDGLLPIRKDYVRGTPFVDSLGVPVAPTGNGICRNRQRFAAPSARPNMPRSSLFGRHEDSDP